MKAEHVKKARRIIGKRWYLRYRMYSLKRMYRLTVDAFVDGRINAKTADKLMIMYCKRIGWYFNKMAND